MKFKRYVDIKGEFYWVIVGDNGRDLAMSCKHHDSAEKCDAEVREVQRLAKDAVYEQTSEPGGHQAHYRWPHG